MKIQDRALISKLNITVACNQQTLAVSPVAPLAETGQLVHRNVSSSEILPHFGVKRVWRFLQNHSRVPQLSTLLLHVTETQKRFCRERTVSNVVLNEPN